MGYRKSLQGSSVLGFMVLCLLVYGGLFAHGDGSADSVVSYPSIPSTDSPYVVLGEFPCFTEEDLSASSFEQYSDLDFLGRCGVADAMLGPEMLPEGERGSIGHVKPSGWHTVKYQNVDGHYLYNRCHLIAWSLSGENDNEKNLITGTRYMNTEGMLPFEMLVLDYIRETGHHVRYRSTPIFTEDNLVADGVVLEAASVEDDEICFYVYCPNVQPGIVIDYATGDSAGPLYQ